LRGRFVCRQFITVAPLRNQVLSWHLMQKDGASCEGVALRSADPSDVVLDMLRERELVSSAYYEDWIEVSLRDGRTVRAVSYIIDPTHVQYCADLSPRDPSADYRPQHRRSWPEL
jgi:cation transport regulator ChaC